MGSSGIGRLTDFVLRTSYDQIPRSTQERAKDLVLDLIGVSAGAQAIDASRIARETAVRVFNAGPGAARARLLFDGRTASRAGAAYAGATQIDALDAHDGFSMAKGHAGCGLLPALLAFTDGRRDVSGADFLAAMIIGYEVASRAGVALHGTVSDYHTSGAWVALAAAALGIRVLGGQGAVLRQAIGIAEYHGPRSQMMREIDNPTMLHDGSGWGSMVGVTSAELALSGFEGAPALTVEAEEAGPYWQDLGVEWLTERQNIKIYPVCRWAHAPIRGALRLREEHGLTVQDIARIEISAFHEAIRLAREVPTSTSKAQYSIDYPVAAALACGQLGPREVAGETFDHAGIAALMAVTEVSECDECNARFPQDRLGRTVITTKDGRRLDSGIVRAPGEPVEPVDRDGIVRKFKAYAAPAIGADRADAIEAAVMELDYGEGGLARLEELIYAPASR